jgi:hypothetical protein
VLLVLSCEGGVLFEETNVDPHPPVILNFQFAPSEMVTGELVRGSFTYVDEGGDIEELLMRSLSGNEGTTPVPFVPGISDVDCQPVECTPADQCPEVEPCEPEDCVGDPDPNCEPVECPEVEPCPDPDCVPVVCPEAPTVFFFPGISGTILWEVPLDTNQGGTHTVKVWLRDSKGSLSEPVFFDVTITF